jgi:hypothetical protein
VNEFSYGFVVDGCYNNYTNGTPTVDPVPGLGGGPWTVDATNTYGADVIGYGASDDYFYQTAQTQGYESSNCTVTVPQQMKMYCATDGNYWPYGANNTGNVNTLSSTVIDSSHIKNSRAGVSSSVLNN